MIKKLRLLFVDDESSARDLLRALLSDVSLAEIVGEAGTVDQAFDEVIRKKPDVLLLDIQLHGESGFDLVEKLNQHNISVSIVFVSAYENYAIRAIRSSACDYLLKPVKKEELVGSLEKISNEPVTGEIGERFSQVISQLTYRKKIKFRYRNGFIMIHPDEILFCRADSNYAILELDRGKSVIVSMNLGSVEKMLPSFCFARISRSLIINLHHLKELDRKTMTCKVANETTHTLSVSKKYLRGLEVGCDKHFHLHN